MDIKSKILLQRHQQAIIDDLDVTYILDELFTKNAISTADFGHIYTLVRISSVIHKCYVQNTIETDSTTVKNNF